ncbi:MAG: HD domain-containing protein [Clostridiaceae bacterium]|nr:HD domain-containing protein [Clostridiaceae bacterium]
MDKNLYKRIERYMIECMTDSAHDKEHVYRVLYVALDMAKYEECVDNDILITASLLHDIGRKEQFLDPRVCHALAGSQKAYDFLVSIGFAEEKAQHIKDCISTHRYRANDPPESIEAKILFDADKIDATGTLGIARTIFYVGQISEPLYTVDSDGNILDGCNDKEPSFFHEYKFKLENIYDKFYTKRANQIARERQKSAVAFYNSMLREVDDSYKNGLLLLKEHLK